MPITAFVRRDDDAMHHHQHPSADRIGPHPASNAAGQARPQAQAFSFICPASEQAGPTLHEQLRSVQELVIRLTVGMDEIRDLLASRPRSKEWYSTQEAAEILNKRPYTVRNWCRMGRVRAEKIEAGRGVDGEWRISHEELTRIQNEGLLPLYRHR